MGGGIITKSKKKKKKDTNGSSQETKDHTNRYFRILNKRFKLLIILHFIFIILLILNITFAFFSFTSKGAIIDAGDGIKLDLESVGDNYVNYNVELKLKNTGDETAKVSITGEAYISEMGSAYGDEATTILKYKYVEISPGETKNLNLGQLTAFNDWHYFVKVHVSWNGGSLELGKILIPGS